MKLITDTIAPRASAEVAVDAILCFSALVLAASTLALKSRVPEFFAQLPLTLASAAIFALVMAAMYALVGLYRPGTISLGATIGRITLAMGAGGFLTNLALRAVGVPESLATLILALAYLGIGLLLVRTGGNVMRRVSPLARVLIVGTGPEAYEIARELSSQGEMSRDVVGLFPSLGGPSAPELSTSGLHVFPENASIPDLVSLHGIQEVIVAVREQRGGGVPMDQLLACRIKGVPVVDFAGFCEKTTRQVPIDSLKGSWLVYGHGFVQGSVRTFVKRLFDIVSSLVLLVLLSPIMLAAMIAVPLDSRGPIFYRQRRIGLGGVEFTCLKFRSMAVDSEKDGVARWAVRNDPRVTRVGAWAGPNHPPVPRWGAFIRKARVGGLAQLFSVLKGEMSLGGPRPERPSF